MFFVKIMVLENLIELKEIQETVEIIDDLFVQKWISTAFMKRIEYYKNSEIKTIFETFPILKNPDGYNLVK